MTFYKHKTAKPKQCPCGIKFTPRGIQKYHDKACEMKHKTGAVNPDNLLDLPLQTLRDIAKGSFCKFIKERDKNLPEITSGKMENKSDLMTGGHLFACNQFPGIMFYEDNCYKQSDFNNLNMVVPEVWQQTATNVLKRIGEKRYQALIDLSNSIYIKNYKFSKSEFIEIIEKYR